jgi:O-antigen/teichoic acid export membrane protein
MRDKKIAKGSFYIFISQGLALLLKVFLVFFLARILGPSKYGQYSAIIAFCLIIEIFFRSGLTGSLVKAVASEEEKAYFLARFGYVTQFIWATFIVSLLFFNAPFLAKYIFNDYTYSSKLKIALLYLMPMALYSVSYAVLVGRKEYIRSALLRFILTLIQFILVFTFLLIWKDVTPLFYALFIASLFGLIFAQLIIPKIKKEKQDIDKKNILLVAFSLMISAVALRAIFQVDKIFVKNILTDDGIVGIYALASNFSLILQIFTMSLVTTLFPSIAFYYAKKDMVLTRKYLSVGTRYSFLAVVPIAFALSVISKDAILLMFGEQYLGSVVPFAILIFASAFFSFFILYRQLLVSLNKHWVNTSITVLVLLAALVLNPLFIKKYGFLGAAWTTFICSAGGALFSGLYIFKLVDQKYPWVSFVKILFASVACYFLAIFARGFGYIVRYSIYLLLVAVFIIFLYIVKELTKEDLETFKGIFR